MPTYDASERAYIEKHARPGETYDEVAMRLQAKTKKTQFVATVRKPPKSDEQADFFIPATLYDVATKDSHSTMDVAVFRLSKKELRASETMKYVLSDGLITVTSGPAGMASIWDYDIVLMAISHLTESINRYRNKKGPKPDRFFYPYVSEILKFCRRSDGGRQTDVLISTLTRLATTHVSIDRTKKAKDGNIKRIYQAGNLISDFTVVSSTKSGKPEAIKIEIPNWMYEEIVESKNPEVLTIHPDFFLIEPGIGRFVYRLARRAAGKGEARWAFKTIYERSGSTGNFRKFSFNLRSLIKSNNLPEYSLSEQLGQDGPILLMTFRDSSKACS